MNDVNVNVLRANFRSTGTIVRACNALINVGRDDGAAAAAATRPRKDMYAHNEGCREPFVRVVECLGSQYAEEDFVANEIENMLRNGICGRRITPADIAVLCRRNKPLVRMRRALTSRLGVGVSIHTGYAHGSDCFTEVFDRLQSRRDHVMQIAIA